MVAAVLQELVNEIAIGGVQLDAIETSLLRAFAARR
jgi:hypothetical protein